MLETLSLWVGTFAGLIAIGHFVRRGWHRWQARRRSFYSVCIRAQGDEGVYDFAGAGWVHIRHVGVNVRNEGRCVYDVVVIINWDGDMERGSVDILEGGGLVNFSFDFPRDGRREVEHDKVPPPYAVCYFTDSKGRRFRVHSDGYGRERLMGPNVEMPRPGDARPKQK